MNAACAAVPQARARRLQSAAALALVLFLLFGCSGGKLVPDEQATLSVIQKCQLKCSMAAKSGVDMSPGPCLGVIGADWACDVAHSPRQPVDDLPQNQCQAYLNGTAHHFVEVTPDCQFIREA